MPLTQSLPRRHRAPSSKGAAPLGSFRRASAIASSTGDSRLTTTGPRAPKQSVTTSRLAGIKNFIIAMAIDSPESKLGCPRATFSQSTLVGLRSGPFFRVVFAQPGEADAFGVDRQVVVGSKGRAPAGRSLRSPRLSHVRRPLARTQGTDGPPLALMNSISPANALSSRRPAKLGICGVKPRTTLHEGSMIDSRM